MNGDLKRLVAVKEVKRCANWAHVQIPKELIDEHVHVHGVGVKEVGPCGNSGHVYVNDAFIGERLLVEYPPMNTKGEQHNGR